ncbi:glucan 1,3-beta-glucosidase isoform X2 [Folsomia candida]|uniref:glucan 1,3-beta-glucosidase isoform X2 n=1 Tax=Folsomia candida TaxID=158441 RepID=UPI0016053219|nr:glucan 1,3-beta-glucosidase isoform X2 [Folsomia candida]
MAFLRFLLFFGILVSFSPQLLTTAQVINYFGVAFSPYVKNAPFPNWDTSYNNGKNWDQCDSNCLISRAAAHINRDHNSVVLSVSQGIYQHDDGGLMSREINNAFSAAQDANTIFGGTVWGLVFTNEFVTDSSNGPRVLQMIRDNKARAHGMNLRVGTRVHTCGEIWGGNNQAILQQIAAESDFIMCNLYPPYNANDPARAVQAISDAYYSARDGFWRTNPQLEVIIGETGWASEGETFNNAVNTIENEKRFWEGMRDWSSANRVKVQMFEAFDEPWKTGMEGEKHFGWWYRPNNNEARYIEKATGQVYQ